MRYQSLLLTIFCNLLYTDEILSATFLSSPIQLPSGETVLGLGYLFGIRISQDNLTLLLYGKNGIFLIQDDHIIQKRVLPGQFFTRCEYSPDGSKLLMSEYYRMYIDGFKQSNSKIYDLIQDKIILTVSEDKTIPSYPFSPDGKNFVYYQEPNVIITYLDTGQQKFLPILSFNSYSFYSDYQQIISTQMRDSYPYLITWDAQTGKEISFTPLNSTITGLIEVLGWGKIPGSIVGFIGNYEPSKPVTLRSDIYIHIWDSESGRILKKWGIRYGAGVYSSSYLELSPDRRWLVNNPENRYAELIDLDKEPSEKTEPDLGPFEGVVRTAFTPDSQSIFLLARENSQFIFSISQLDLANNTLHDKRYLCQFERNNCIFSPDGRYLTNFNYSNNINYINLLDWKQSTVPVTIEAEFSLYDIIGDQAAFSPDGKQLLWGNYRTASLWDTTTGKQIHLVETGKQETQSRVAFSPDGSKFLTSGFIQRNTPLANIVNIWDSNTLVDIRTLKGHTDTILSAHFSPDGKQVITASDDQTAKLWDAETGQLISTYINPASGVYYAEFFPDGKRAITADYDHTIHILNSETGAAQTILQNVNYPAALSPNGKWLFAGTQVWDTATWKIIKILDGVEQDLNALTVSPDNQWLLTSETNGITKVWSIEDQIIKPSEIKQFQEY